MNEDKNGVSTWNIYGHKLQHFDGGERPEGVLKAIRKWIKDTDNAPTFIRIECIPDENEVWRYTGTVEYCGKFVV